MIKTLFLVDVQFCREVWLKNTVFRRPKFKGSSVVALKFENNFPFPISKWSVYDNVIEIFIEKKPWVVTGSENGGNREMTVNLIFG